MPVLFSKTNCPSCLQLKKKLKNEGINFEERNVNNDEEAYVEMIMVGEPGMSFPVIKINGAYYYNKSDDWIVEKIKSENVK